MMNKWIHFTVLLLIGLLVNNEKNSIFLHNKLNNIIESSYLNFPGFTKNPKLTINSEITHWILSSVPLSQIENLISQLESEIETLTTEFNKFKANSKSIRENYDKHQCQQEGTKKQKGNRCNTCEKRANAIKRLQLKMKELASKIVTYQLKLDKCKYRKSILKGEQVEKEVMYRPFTTHYQGKTLQEKADLQKRRKDKAHEREIRRNKRLLDAVNSGILTYNKHNLYIQSQKQREMDFQTLVISYFQPKSLILFTHKLLIIISQVLENLIQFDFKKCLDDLFQIKIEKIQKTLKSHYEKNTSSLNHLQTEKDNLTSAGKNDQYLETRINILKNTLNILNRSILYTQVLQTLCLYDLKTNNFISSSLPTICESENFLMLRKELDLSKQFNNITIKRLLDNFNQQLKISSTEINMDKDVYNKFKAIHNQIWPLLQFIYKKCVELRFTVNNEDLNLDFDEFLFPIVSRFPQEYYTKAIDSLSFNDFIIWFSSSNQINLANNLSMNMILVILEKILDFLKIYRYILNKIKNITKIETRNQYILKCSELKFQLNKLMSILTMHMIKTKEITITSKQFKTKIKSTDKDSLNQLISNDLKLINSTKQKTCNQTLLSLLYYRHLQLDLILENGRRFYKKNHGKNDDQTYIANLLKQ
ncbi:Uncharacterized protein cpbgf_800690, partial [Cryptosporidium parvum]